jgi:hypothetical protein
MNFTARHRAALALLLLVMVPLAGMCAEPERGRTAFLKSLVVPGWGQYSLGRNNSALAFFGADLALVGGILTLQSYGRLTRGDYQALARAHAGVTGGHPHDYYVDVGNWMTVAEYNERRLEERNYTALYTSAQDSWVWDSNANRAKMENTRIKSDRAFNRVIYFVGGMVLNHVASAIHAGRMAARLREADAQQTQLLEPAWDLNVEPLTPTAGVQLRLVHNF